MFTLIITQQISTGMMRLKVSFLAKYNYFQLEVFLPQDLFQYKS